MRVRAEHWELLLNYCEQYPELITNKFNGSEGRVKGNALWQSISTKLNSLGFGEKSVDGWRKALIDWKSKTKSKAAAMKREQQETGGGPPKALPPMSALEERLLNIMGKKALHGDESVPELGFGKVEIPRQSEVSKENQNPETNPSTSSPIISEHDYCNEVTAGSSTTNRKRKCQIKPPNKILKSKKSNELLRLSSETVSTLKQICDNTSSIAESLSILANIAKSYQK